MSLFVDGAEFYEVVGDSSSSSLDDVFSGVLLVFPVGLASLFAELLCGPRPSRFASVFL